MQNVCDVVKSYIAVKQLTTHHCGRRRETCQQKGILFSTWFMVCRQDIYRKLQMGQFTNVNLMAWKRGRVGVTLYEGDSNTIAAVHQFYQNHKK